jgi:nicotinamide mononucleotide adenylyltransferase
MPTKPKPPRSKSKPKTARERMQTRRDRLRLQGLRPIQHWVPDLRDPKVRADLRRQAKLLAKHPENDEIDKWIEAVVDPRDRL